MCSVQEDGSLPQKTIKSLEELTCVKCKRKDAPVVITRVNDAFCSDCFLVYAVHKFRSAIGKSKVIMPKDHVLVAFSGGPMSAALLHFIREGIREGKLRFSATVLHISELSLVSLMDGERISKVEDVIQKIHERGFPVLLSSIERAMEVGTNELTASQGSLFDEVNADSDLKSVHHPIAGDRLKALLAALPSVSAKEEFLRVLKTQLLVAIARQGGFSKVVVGDTATLLSIRIMTDIAKGKGSQVSFDTSIGDQRYGDVMVVRPLRDLNEKEVEVYNQVHHIEAVSLPTFKDKDKWSVANSIEQLTTTFIKDLNEDYPSTVSNIVRTSAKLSEGESLKVRGLCAMCQSPLDTDVGEASALHAVEMAEKLQQQGRGSSEDQHCPQFESSLSSVNHLLSSLCYGCRLVTKNLCDESLLPALVTKTLNHRAMTLEEMRQQIGEFLLEDDSADVTS